MSLLVPVESSTGLRVLSVTLGQANQPEQPFAAALVVVGRDLARAQAQARAVAVPTFLDGQTRKCSMDQSR